MSMLVYCIALHGMVWHARRLSEKHRALDNVYVLFDDNIKILSSHKKTPLTYPLGITSRLIQTSKILIAE
jgi:hypothetical protein